MVENERNGEKMKALFGFLAGLGVLGYLLMVLWVLFALVAAIYGLYLALCASILLGVVVFLVEPSPLIIGLVMIFFHKNLAQMLIDFLNK